MCSPRRGKIPSVGEAWIIFGTMQYVYSQHLLGLPLRMNGIQYIECKLISHIWTFYHPYCMSTLTSCHISWLSQSIASEQPLISHSLTFQVISSTKFYMHCKPEKNYCYTCIYVIYKHIKFSKFYLIN